MAGGLDTSASLFNAPSVLSSSTGGVYAPLRHTNRRGASCRCLSSATSAEELSGTTVAVFRPADQALPSSLLEPWSAPTSLRMWLFLLHPPGTFSLPNFKWWARLLKPSSSLRATSSHLSPTL